MLQRARLLGIIGKLSILLQQNETVAGRSRFIAGLNEPLSRYELTYLMNFPI